MNTIDLQEPAIAAETFDTTEAKKRLTRRLAELDGVIGELGRRFARSGYEIALVGGSVRDAFLGRETFDLDLTTNAGPDEIVDVIGGWADAQWEIGREFGTIGLRKAGETLEITTYRAEQYRAQSRKPQVRFGDSLDGDLFRRDFTIGAMAVRLPDMAFVDPFGGLDDLTAGVLRTPGSPADSFSDDPLRMLRAARFASQLAFRVHPDAASAMADMSDRLEIVSAERVQAELVKLICGKDPRSGLELLVDTGLADRVLPEVSALSQEKDEHHRHKDVYQHTLTVLEQAIDLEGPRTVDGPDFIVRFAAVMHDVGKPATRRFGADGKVTFHHHDVVGAKMTASRMKQLRFDKETTKSVARLVELHLRFFGYGDAGWTDSAVRRYATDAGDLLPRLHILTRSDVTTRNRKKAERLAHAYDDLERRIAALKEQEKLDAVRPDLDGREIMRILDIPPGPAVGEAYKFLLDQRMGSGPLSKDEAERRLKEWWGQG